MVGKSRFVTAGILLLSILGYVLYSKVVNTDNVITVAAPLPALYTERNMIIKAGSHEPVVLKGIISEYFRYKMNSDYPSRDEGLVTEHHLITSLKKAGANINIVGLYLANLKEIKENLDELDAYINFAANNGLYVFLAPTGNSFIETTLDNRDLTQPQFQGVRSNDLRDLTELLASRYGNLSNVLLYLTAEPNISYLAWEKEQPKLADIVRKYTSNPIIVSVPYYSPYYSLPTINHGNVIYSTGGYVSRNDNSNIERRLDQILWTSDPEHGHIQDYPIIVAEFGGNYGRDFSTSRDLQLFQDLLTEIEKAELSYTVYRLRSEFDDDGLALFDPDGNPTPKGEIFINSFIETSEDKRSEP